MAVQDASTVDDGQRPRSELDTAATFFDTHGSTLSTDSVELGMPHEPLSITFFKTAFQGGGGAAASLALPHSLPERPAGAAPRRPVGATARLPLEGLPEEAEAEAEAEALFADAAGATPASASALPDHAVIVVHQQ